MKAYVSNGYNNQIQIKEATIKDAEAITDIHSSSWKSAYKGILSQDYLDNEVEAEKRNHWIKELAAPESKYNFVLLALDAGEPVGFIGVYDSSDNNYDAFIDNLHVKPDVKGKGIGQKLMVSAAHKLKSFGKKSVYLWVYDDNVPAFGFYNKLGAVMADKSICIIHGKEISQTRFYWNDLSILK